MFLLNSRFSHYLPAFRVFIFPRREYSTQA